MDKKYGMLIICAAILFLCFVGTASARTWYVDDDGGADFTGIQDAINNATDGDTVIVRDGIYIESIVVNKSLTIKSENGPAKSTLKHAYVTADYVEISGFMVEGSTIWSDGILLYNADYCNISNNNCSNNDDGIYLYKSNDNTISNNICSNNDDDGISLSYSNNNKLTGNIMLENGIDIWGDSISDYTHEIDESNTVNGKPVYYWKNREGGRIPDGSGQVILVNCKNILVENQNLNNGSAGIQIAFSSYITIKSNKCNNSITDNSCSVYLIYSNNNSISANNCSNNLLGIKLYESHYNSIFKNTCSNNGWRGIVLGASWKNTIIDNKVVNNEDYGIILLSESYLYGFVKIGSDSNIIKGNNVASNKKGICISDSCFNIIKENNVTHNGIGLDISAYPCFGYCYPYSSMYNEIYLNNFINNTNNSFCESPGNAWSSTEEKTYAYKGKSYKNYLGNYWDDYMDIDADSNGIWDNPRKINVKVRTGENESDEDLYPLVDPFENYFYTNGNIFDTGKPSNPYPSIFGTYNGTIKPNKMITATKLYTNPCEGTSGHPEYAKIYNDSWSIETLAWNGYEGDWRTLPFTEPFKLYANVEYNYTIKAGSYPQIHHTPTLLTENGWINCSEFIDANGRVYNDWIPAIRLE